MELSYIETLSRVQEYIAKTYPRAITELEKQPQLHSYIESYLQNHNISVLDLTIENLIEKLYSDMVEYAGLTLYLNREDVEEININGWDDISITYTDGHSEKAPVHFPSPENAVDVIRRLLQHSGMIIDNAMPKAQGHLPGNARITVLKDPLMDPERCIGASIRLLHPSKVTYEHLISGGCATEKMLEFLCLCLNYGVSIKLSISHMKERLDDEVFGEWCDILIMCQDDRTLKDMLQPTVTKLTDMRIINNELQTILYSAKVEYWTMAALVVGSIPMMYFFNRDWLGILMNSLPGQIVLSICAAVLMITVMLAEKYTRPMKFKR